MSSDAGSAPPARPRPLAELGLEHLAARGEELARLWAIALIRARPFAQVGEVPLEALARDAPALCAQAIRALQSDVELDRLTGGGGARERSALAPRLAALAGAADPVALARAVEALRSALWQALLDEVRAPGSERSLGELGDRLAHVCAELLVAALAPQQDRPAEAPVTREAIPETAIERERGAATAAVIIDERARAAASAGAEPVQRRRPSNPGPAGVATLLEERDAWGAGAAPEPRDLEIAIRDQRSDSGPAAWISSIARQLERYEREGQPFAVLLVEPLEIERLRRSESSAELASLAGSIERALVRELGLAAPAAGAGRGAAFGAAALTRQHPGRHWLLVAASERAALEALAQRMADAVAAAVEHRGAPLSVVVGTALCPEDGREAATLAAHADVGLYAARAAARGTGSAGDGRR